MPQRRKNIKLTEKIQVLLSKDELKAVLQKMKRDNEISKSQTARKLMLKGLGNYQTTLI